MGLYDAMFRGKFQPLLKNMKKWTVSYSIVENIENTVAPEPSSHMLLLI